MTQSTPLPGDTGVGPSKPGYEGSTPSRGTTERRAPIRECDPRAVKLRDEVELVYELHRPSSPERRGFLELIAAEYGGKVTSRTFGHCLRYGWEKDEHPAITYYGYDYPDWALSDEVLERRRQMVAAWKASPLQVRRVKPALIRNELISIQPMEAPVGAIFFLDSKF